MGSFTSEVCHVTCGIMRSSKSTSNNNTSELTQTNRNKRAQEQSRTISFLIFVKNSRTDVSLVAVVLRPLADDGVV